MRILVTGRTGQLAQALGEAARETLDGQVINIGRDELDLEYVTDARPAVAAARPDLIVNAAAYTAVDKAESEPDRAFTVNCKGAAAIARSAADLRIPFIQISTDYVFDGGKKGSYVESDPTGPVNCYGASKLAGERAVLEANPEALIIRTSWVFSAFGNNFVRTMLNAAATRPLLRVVNDQVGKPTSALDLASAIIIIAPKLSGMGGIYHYAGASTTSWHGFAEAIFAESRRLGGPSPQLEAITTAEYPTPARRPENSVLDTSAFTQQFGVKPRLLTDALPQIVARLLAS